MQICAKQIRCFSLCTVPENKDEDVETGDEDEKEEEETQTRATTRSASRLEAEKYDLY